MTAIETDFFDDKCDEYIEGYRYVPDGETWTRDDGEEFTGEMISPWKDWAYLDSLQKEYEIAQLKAQIAELEAGSAGGGLNFEVIGSETEPSEPTENMIWVEVSVPMGNYNFQNSAPQNPNENDIWIKTSVSSETAFDAIADTNVLRICPIQAYLFDGNDWVEKTGRIYQDGNWKNFVNGIYLYNMGTWGFLGAFDANQYTNTEDNLIPSVTYETNCIQMVGKARSNALYYQAYGTWLTSPLIDLTDYSSLHIEFNNLSIGWGEGGFSIPANFTSLTAAISIDEDPTFVADCIKGLLQNPDYYGKVSNTQAQVFYPTEGIVSGKTTTTYSDTLVLDLTDINIIGTIVIGLAGGTTNNYMSDIKQRNFQCNITRIWLE